MCFEDIGSKSRTSVCSQATVSTDLQGAQQKTPCLCWVLPLSKCLSCHRFLVSPGPSAHTFQGLCDKKSNTESKAYLQYLFALLQTSRCFFSKTLQNTDLAAPGGPSAPAGAGHSSAGLSPPGPLLLEKESLCSAQVRWEEHRMTPHARYLP